MPSSKTIPKMFLKFSFACLLLFPLAKAMIKDESEPWECEGKGIN